MKTIKLTEILEYYDGIQIFAARDPIGGHYVGDMIDTVGDDDRYLVVGVRPERLDDLRAGKVDLRALLLETPGGEWYIATAKGTIDDPHTLIPQSTPLADSDYLPDDGFFLGPDPDAPVDDQTIRNAVDRGKAVTVTGQIEQVNRSAGEWALLTDHGVKAGKTFPGGPGLDGLRVGKRYRFRCAQVAELDLLRQDRQTLYLQSVEAA